MSPMKPVQCKMARAAVDWSVADLAKAAQVPVDMIARLELGDAVEARMHDHAKRALEAQGLEFIDGGEPGVKLKAKPRSIAVEYLNATND